MSDGASHDNPMPAASEEQGVSLFCGVDIGASATKLVLLDASKSVRARVVRASGVDYAGTAQACLDDALAIAGPGSAIACTVATGYGRRNVAFADRRLTEIQCHGLGCFHLVPRAITVVDIGGQDNKVIRIGADGQRIDFKMNRKCAAGTGAFLEEIAVRLALDVSELDALAQQTTEVVRLSSFCTVFAKTEILAHLRKGTPVGPIVRGAYHAVVLRVLEMDPLEGEVILTGGVAEHSRTVADVMTERLGRAVHVPPNPQFTGALGAALAALG